MKKKCQFAATPKSQFYAFSDCCNAEGHIKCYSENYKYLNDKSPYCISQILFALKCITLAVLN